MNDLKLPEAPTDELDIKGFITKQLEYVKTDDYTQLKSGSESLKKFGFGNCANFRYTEFLDTFQGNFELTQKYQEEYPNSIFLPWEALHKTMEVLDLWFDHSTNYIGAVPTGQIPYIEMFDFNTEHNPKAVDLQALLKWETHVYDSFESRRLERSSVDERRVKLYSGDMFVRESNKRQITEPSSDMIGLTKSFVTRTDYNKITSFFLEYMFKPVGEIGSASPQFTIVNGNIDTPMAGWGSDQFGSMTFKTDTKQLSKYVNLAQITELKREFQEDLFVVAPAEAFNTTQSWIRRARELSFLEIKVTTPPNDPLVVKAVEGGVLVVASWGGEAKYINELINKLNI